MDKEILIKDDFNISCEIMPGVIITLRRIADCSKFKQFKLISIGNSAYFYFGLQISKDHLKLPKLYAALYYLTGESDVRHDDYKGSYSFMFELEVQKNNKTSKYCYHIYHYRSYIEFTLYHIVAQDDVRNPQHVHQPDDELFSDEEICTLSESFCNYAIRQIEEDKYIPQPFVKFSDSNLLIFGYSKGEYFFKDHEDQEKYIAEKCLLQQEILPVYGLEDDVVEGVSK